MATKRIGWYRLKGGTLFYGTIPAGVPEELPPGESALERPDLSAVKADWAAYAATLGIDVAGLSKAKIVALVEASDDGVESGDGVGEVGAVALVDEDGADASQVVGSDSDAVHEEGDRDVHGS